MDARLISNLSFSHSSTSTLLWPRNSLFASPRNSKRKTIVRCTRAAGDPSATNDVVIQDKSALPIESTPPDASQSQPLLDCVVVGAGISGLTIAQALSTRHNHNNFILTEARDRAGGNIITVQTDDGYLWEQGPNSFQPTDPMLALAVDSGLKDDLVFGDPDAPRFVLWNGKLRPVFIRSWNDCRVVGSAGVYAGDPAKLSMKAAFGKVWKLEQDGGSIIGGALKAVRGKSISSKSTRDPRLPNLKGQTVGSFNKGLTMLPDAISARLGRKLKLSWRLTSIRKLHGGDYSLTYDTPEGPITVQSRSVVMTVPSHVASCLLQPLSLAAAESLSQFYYPPVAAVSVSYSKDSIRPECLMDGELKGFGQLHPRSQGVETLGTIYSSSLFPNRAPAGRILLLNYIGGATNPGIVSFHFRQLPRHPVLSNFFCMLFLCMLQSEGLLVESVDRDLRKILIRPNAKDPVVLGVKVWPQAIPQFLIGHYDLLDSTKAALQRDGLQGLFLAGNYVTGVALGKCVEGAYEITTEVVSFLSRYVS
uniref:Protoporphyrinogen oxidase n=1 Tax=Kalanchoe fedtschenkoi TaxID=63787 RepID=A0A7N0V7C0_KALFE